MEDPLLGALAESPAAPLHPAPDVVEQHTAHPQPVRDILEDVRMQATAAFAVPFFDGEGNSSSEPIVKVGVSEAGTVHITAQRHDPPYRAELTLYARSELRSTDNGHYELRGRCELIRDVEKAARLSDFAIGLAIAPDGMVTLDVAQLRAELAQAIRSFG